MSVPNTLVLGIYPNGDVLTPYGRTFKIEDIEISRADRTASGKYVKDIIAIKKRFILDYDVIGTTDLDLFLSYYDLQTELYFQWHYATGYYNEYYVLMQPINRQRFRLIDEGLWTGVTIVLDEV